MKPLKLSMGAFGPYPKVQKIDFGELGERSIFLIHGPTGSGKTTILDGICFALYGDTSGAERNGKNMRSHYAGLDQLTEVIFDFEIRGNQYRVHRIPEQDRLKRSGTGTTIQRAEANLWKLDENEEVLIETGWKGVTDAVETIIGFRSSQFRQVIMLPQGQFRKLLMADSLERQDILEKLFQTGIYRKIEESLKQSAKVLGDEIKEMEKKKDFYLDNAGCQNISELEIMICEEEEKFIQVKNELKQKTSLVEKARDLLKKGEEGNKKLEEREKFQKGLEKLKEKIPQFEVKKEEFKKAQRAANLFETETGTRLRSKDKKTCEEDLEKAKDALSKAIKNHDLMKKKLDEEKDREMARDKARNERIRLEGYREKVQGLENLRKSLEDMKGLLNKSEREKEALEKRIKELDEKIAIQRTLVDEAKEYTLKLPIYKGKFEERERSFIQKRNLEDLVHQLKKIESEYEIEEKHYKKFDGEYIKTKKEYFALQEVWNRGQAAILAEGIEDDLPCPVCGSLHHPHLAQKESWMPTEEEIKEKQMLLETLEKQKDKYKDEKNKKYSEKEKIESAIKILEDELGKNKDIEMEKLNETMETAKVAWERAVKKSDELDGWLKTLQKMEDTEKEIKGKLEEIEKEIKIKGEHYQNTVGALKSHEESIPEEIRNMDELIKAQEKAKNDLEKLIDDYEKVKKAYEKAENMLTGAKTSKIDKEKAHKKAEEEYLKEKEAFVESLRSAGFEKYGDYDQAKKDEEIMRKLEREIKDFEGNMRSLEDQYKGAIKEAEGILQVDLEGLKNDSKNAEKDKDESIRIEHGLGEKIKEEKKILKGLTTLEESIKEKEREYAVVGKLSETSNGNNVHRLTFQRFVLSTLLDDITISATERLKLMSKGRYHLRRTLDRARKNAAGGLELEVFDTYTGLERPVTTLSGGETFIASLSLALGLADVVQSYSGGISLDTIFVDEGFGSLDPESLDFAMKTLIDLQKGGRLVGIISHVPELKERMDARLEVIPVDQGSVAKFRIS